MESQTAPVATTTPLDPKEVVQKILAGLDIPSQVELQNLDGALLLHIRTADPGRLIGRRGQTLSQLQFLVNRILLRHDTNAPRVTIDCESYQEKQNDELLQRTIEAADKVRRWGDPVHIGPYSALDRRAIHEHFAADRELEAISEPGDEAGRKKMTIRVRQTPRVATPAPR